MGFTDSVIVDVAGIEIPGQFPVHRDHDTSKVVGHATARRQQGKLVVSGIASASNDYSREVVDSARNGFPWQASIGASIKASPEEVQAGETTEVNGRRVRGPVRVFRKTRLDEVSFVSIGADRNTTTSVAASFTEVKGMTFQQWLKAMGFDIDSMEESQVTAMRQVFDKIQASGDSTEGDGEGETEEAPEAAPEAPDADPAPQTTHQAVAHADPAAIAAASYNRIGYVQKHLQDHPQLAAKALTENWSEDRCRLEGLLASRSQGPGVHATANVVTADILSAAVNLHTGVSSEDALVREFNEQTVTAARRHIRDMSITYLVHEVMRSRGQYVHSGVAASPEMVRDLVAQDAAFEQGIMASSSGSSSVTLTGVLSNNANKALLEGYMTPVAIRNQVCAVTSHSDFKTNSKYRVGSAEFLAELPPNGQLDHMTLDEEAYTNAVKTYGRMLTLTRTMIINDDLGAFTGIASSMGRRASQSLERFVFETLLSNLAIFVHDADVPTNGHLPNEVASAAANALSTTSLKTAETLFRRQVDKFGNPIMVDPGVILCPSDIRRIADDLIQFSNISVLPSTSTTGKLDEANAFGQIHVANRWVGGFTVADTPWLSTSGGLANGDINDWFLVANPSRSFALMEIAFLRGRQTPTVESAPTSFDTLGTSWRVYFDYGVAMMDPRAGVRMIVA